MAFVQEVTRAPPGHLEPGTRLNADLGLTGDDAGDFLAWYAEEFGVDLSRLRFLDHFDWEGITMGRGLYLAIASAVSPAVRTALRAARARESDITIQHLVDCARAGEWSPPQGIPRTRNRALWTWPFRLAWRGMGILLPFLMIGAFCFGAVLLISALKIEGNLDHFTVASGMLFTAAAVLGLEIWATIRWYQAKTGGLADG